MQEENHLFSPTLLSGSLELSCGRAWPARPGPPGPCREASPGTCQGSGSVPGKDGSPSRLDRDECELSLGGQALLPHNQQQDTWKWPQAVPEDALIGHQEEFLNGKSGQALKELPREGMEFSGGV